MPWFDSFPVTGSRREVAAGEVLLRREVVPREALYLKKGRVAAGLLEAGGLRNLLVDSAGPCWLDVGSVLGRLPCVADYVADRPSELLLFPADAVRRWFAALPEAARVMVHDAAAAHRQQAEAMLGLMVKDAEARCAQWLLQHAERLDHGQVAVTMRERKRAIAARLGIAPETLSRVLRHLRELGFINQSGSVMHLIDPGGLQRLASMQGA
jgi:CRP-like cAMP-binding protein